MAHSSIIAVGASAGGVTALRSLASELPEMIGIPILVVLHIGSQQSVLPALLNSVGPVPAKHAEDDELILPNRIYVAPPDRHMVVAGGRVRLFRGPKENCARPAIDPLFRSVAESYGPAAVGVILTGNQNDGTLGLFEIARRGGITIAQDPGDAAYPDMPRSAVEHVALDYTLRLADMPKLFVDLASGKEKAVPIKPLQSKQSPEIIDSAPFELPVPSCTFNVTFSARFRNKVKGVGAADVAATRKSAVDFEESDRVAVRRSGLRSNVRMRARPQASLGRRIRRYWHDCANH